MPTIPTIAIDRDGHRAVINLSDFNPEIHTKWGEEAPVIAPVQIPRAELDKAAGLLGIEHDPTIGDDTLQQAIEAAVEAMHTRAEALEIRLFDALTLEAQIEALAEAEAAQAPAATEDTSGGPGLSPREALEASAKLLGVEFHPNIGDEKLEERVDAAVADLKDKAEELEIPMFEGMTLEGKLAAVAEAEKAKGA